MKIISAQKLLVLTIVVILSMLINGLLQQEEEDTLPFEKYVIKYGYPLQTHQIETSDGYILKYFRIQNKNKTNIDQWYKKVVLLQHGFIDSADGFITNSQPDDHAFGFYLANQGYDVWLANTRGNYYSRKHTVYDADNDPQFWKFSADDLIKDLEASFKYIYQHTGQKIQYIGHSQGAQQMFTALSIRNPTIEQILDGFIALNPAVYMNTEDYILTNLIGNEQLFGLIYLLGIEEVMSSQWNQVSSSFCTVLPWICELMMQMISDRTTELDNMDRIKVFMGHYPKGSSTQMLEHFAQIVRKGKLCKYNSDELYPIDRIRFNKTISVYLGGADRIVNSANVDLLIAELRKNHNSVNRRYYADYGHFTTLFAKRPDHYRQIVEDIELE